MNAEELIERFRKSLNAPSSKDEKYKVVLICIVISTTFWFFNALNQDDYTTQINYPVSWTYDGQGYQVVGELPERIPVEVAGGGWDLMTRSFGFNMTPIQISLSSPDESKYILTSQLRGELSRNLDPVTINYIIADSLNYDIQRITERTIALRLDDSGISVDSDYRISSEYSLSPDSIKVSGPISIVSQMPSVLPVLADINNVDEDYEGDVDLPALPRLVSSEVDKTTLRFELMRYINITERHNIELVNLPDTSWKAEIPEVLVQYVIGEAEFDATDSTRIRIVADFQQMSPQDSTVQLEVIEGRSLIENLTLSIQEVKIIK